MKIEFSANELHTIAGWLYPYVNSLSAEDELSSAEQQERKELILDVGYAILNQDGLLELSEGAAWDFRDHVPYSAMVGAEPTGRSIHAKLWAALLKEKGYVELHFEADERHDSTYKDAYESARARADNSSSAHDGTAQETPA